MSIDMYLNDSLTQATSASNFCQKQVTDYQNPQQAITQFTLQTPNLQGKTYDAAKAIFPKYFTHSSKEESYSPKRSKKQRNDFHNST
ncbi:hypothetical protein [Enterococcus mundtii]|uniref:hypothetical protein n=1 Tax=Enterococcus mundtii TaxID=53346 RepID=UPI0020C7B8B4|nr:hypothetical protein [Enterococcus mundtii]